MVAYEHIAPPFACGSRVTSRDFPEWRACSQAKISGESFTQKYNITKYTQLRPGNQSLGSLSNSVFERRTSTGRGLFESLGSGLVQTLG